MTNLIMTEDREDNFVLDADNEQVQLDWIRGLIEQIEFANRPDVLPDFVLHLIVTRRWE